MVSSSFLRHYDETKTLLKSQHQICAIGADGEQFQTKQRVLLVRLVNEALEGNMKAATQVLTMIVQILGVEDERASRTDLTPSELDMLDSYLAGDLITADASDPCSDTPNEASELQADASGNGNHNNFTNTTVPDEESDDEPSC